MDEYIIGNAQKPPLDSKGRPKHRFEVKMRVLGSDPQKDGIEKAVFIDGKKLDFKIDVLRFLEAKTLGVESMIREQKRIEVEFIRSVSEAIGRRVTKEELKMATIEGWI
jgi:hypothetical protein